MSIPIDTPEAKLAAAVLEVCDKMDATAKLAQDPNTSIDSNDADTLLYIVGSKEILNRICEEALTKAKTAFVEHLSSEDVREEMKRLSVKD